MRNCAYSNDFAKPKIIFSEIVSEPQFYYDEKGYFPEATVFFISGKHLKYLTALLNSKPVTYIFKTFYAGGELVGKYRYKKSFLENLPIPEILNTKIFDLIVDYLLFQKRTPSVSASFGHYFEQILDGMVCELYFSEEMVSKGLDIIGLVTADLSGLPDFSTLNAADKQGQIEQLYQKWTASGSEIQARLGLMVERSPDVLGVILGGK